MQLELNDVFDCCVLCPCYAFVIQAAQRNLVYPHYAWIIYAWYPEGWWREDMANETLEGCPDEVLEDFLIQSRAQMIHILPEPDDIDSITDAGIVRISVTLTLY